MEEPPVVPISDTPLEPMPLTNAAKPSIMSSARPSARKDAHHEQVGPSTGSTSASEGLDGKEISTHFHPPTPHAPSWEEEETTEAKCKNAEQKNEWLKKELKELRVGFATQKKELRGEYQKQVDDMFFFGYQCCMKKNDITQDTPSYPSDDEDPPIGGPVHGDGVLSVGNPSNGQLLHTLCIFPFFYCPGKIQLCNEQFCF